MIFLNVEKPYFLVSYSDEENYKPSIGASHHHRFYEIYYLLKNEVMYYIDNNIYHTVPGTVVVIPPNTIHTTRTLNRNKRKRIIVYLNESYISSLLEDDKELLIRLHTKPFLIDEQKREKIENLFFTLLKESEREDSNTVLVKSLLGQLLVELGILAESSLTTDTLYSNNPTTKQMLKIVDYINSNYSQKITLSSLSKIFYLNPSYISRSFKDKISISFSEYLRAVRIKEACLLLETTDFNLSEIAEKTGFSDSSDLCRSFKELMNTTPKKYKKH